MSKTNNASAANSKRAKAALLDGMGLPSKLIAENVGCTVFTLSKWRGEPEYGEMVETARERLAEKLVSVHAYAQSAAAGYLVSVLDNRDAESTEKLEAAKVLLTWKFVPTVVAESQTGAFDAVMNVLQGIKA